MQGLRTSIRYEDHTGMLHKLTKKAMGVVTEAKLSENYDDLFGMMCVSFVKCQQSYDPESGFAFTSYFGRACWNNFVKWLRDEMEVKISAGMISVEDMRLSGEDGDDADVWDILADEQGESPEEIVTRKLDVRHKLRGLSRDSKMIVRELLSPSDALKALCRQEAQKGRPDDVTLRLIGEALDFSRPRMARARIEIGNSFNIKF